MTMAGTMIHLVIAVRIAENIKKNGYKIRLADGSNIHFDKNMFIAGNICPDGIMERKNYERNMKLHTHFRDGIPDGDFGKNGTIKLFEKRMADFWSEHCEDERVASGLYLGYITHMMTDKRFILYERPKYFQNISKIGLTERDRETFVYFNKDTDLVDFKLVKEMPELSVAEKILRETRDYYIKNMITKEELDKSRRWIIKYFFEEKHIEENSKFLDYNSILKFCGDTVNYILDRLKNESYLDA